MLYLFPAQSSNQFIYSIVPHNAIKDYRIGPKIGEMLVKDNLVSEGQIGSILEEQNDKRAQPLGEMRDLETTSTGIEASLTGHLVFATLHTNSAPESIIRLLDMGMDPFNFADSLLGVLAQRLAKKLCPDCKK